ncbi:dTDP-4-keto-6-deoxy-D-glucose epimerase [Actinomadura craniellae]|uniref:dTDP-4-keto-6-deoxy-D-glucose epimerase n=1 Tax=Actinomadura craniellae TaxID=2231787 RepID=A0A365H2Z3_9ACTN|nr:dTDP-4-dehydrorhamnose 3,5-epimerase [Actinomadura craniellae]RAY12593.1 dTDP-4-keto-6-deoxy-D-glucose epimerase [Actinomadura craniellae]
MKTRRLAVEGALEFTPRVNRDDRGLFVSVFHETAFEDAHDGPLFPVAQTSLSASRRDVVRGVHYTATPPGTAKYVHCVRGRALDIVVDLRVGSPTFGRWDAVELDATGFRAVYYPVGVGHAFVALADDTALAYLLSRTYDPADERSVDVLDPELGLPIPRDVAPVLSPRDAAAPTLAEARELGLLPDHHESHVIEKRLSAPGGTS